MPEIAHIFWDFSLWAAGLGKIPDDGWLIRPSIIWRMRECHSPQAMRALYALD
ncbi:MAG TPA: hypothetical protein VN884_06780 [Candidatus Sulfotelmatobacter sp.]|jgi:hypothetical protein|nr:hypothetical protein [Candidatus Sulfotelmatobacter sp.]